MVHHGTILTINNNYQSSDTWLLISMCLWKERFVFVFVRSKGCAHESFEAARTKERQVQNWIYRNSSMKLHRKGQNLLLFVVNLNSANAGKLV